MTRMLTVFFLVPFLGSAVGSSAHAQGYSVYTTVRSAENGEAVGPVLGRSHTILHAGKSYDHMEMLSEVVISNPTKRRFTILHEGRVGTRVDFEELQQYINVGRTETETYARELSGQPGQSQASQMLLFQLMPHFDVSQTEDRLSLAAPAWTYNVDLGSPDDALRADSYADYADRAARLNYVLHPQSFYPALREALNDELRKRGQVPIRVHLKAELGEQIELVAEHKFRWELQNFDRLRIQQFEQLAESDDVEWITFREYQQRVLGSR